MTLANAFSGSLFMVVAPSGAGKSTLVNALLAQEPALKLSISTTTRAAARRDARQGILFHDGRGFHGARGGRRVPRMGRGTWQLLRHLAHPGRTADEDRHRHPAGNRLARRAPGEKTVPAGGRHLYFAAVDRGAGGAFEQARHRRTARH